MNGVRCTAARFGKVLATLNYAVIAALLLALLSQFLSILLAIIAIIFWLCIMVATWFILLLSEEFVNFPTKAMEFVGNNIIFNFTMNYLPIFLGVIAGLAIVSSLLMFADRNYRRQKARIIINFVFGGIAIIGIILWFILFYPGVMA